MLTRTKGSMRLCVALLCANILFIWGNSLLPAELSGALSGWAKDVIYSLLPESGESAQTGSGLLRKFAHFAEFCSLGMCMSWLVRMYLPKVWQHWLLPLLAALAVACVDESIQHFVPGRNPALKDVGIDTLGIVLGIVIISLIQYLKKYFKEKRL